MPLLNDFLEKFCEVLRVFCSEWRIWKGWSETKVNLEDFNYELIAPVRSSEFNKAFSCRYRDSTHHVVLIKEIAISDGNKALQSSVIGKLKSLHKYHNENVVRLKRILTRENYVYLVYESFTIDLCYFIGQPKDCRDSEVKNFVYQILSAVMLYHSCGVPHGDLKPQHILIDFRNRLLKLADFGLIRSTIEDLNTSYPITSTALQYMAPERLLGSCACSLATDMWSVGCIFGEMVTGRVVFEQPVFTVVRGTSEMGQLRAIFRLLGTPSEDSWPEAAELYSSLSSFPTFEPMDLAAKFEGLEPEGLDLLSQMLCLDPNKRISAKDALKHTYIKNFIRQNKALLAHKKGKRKIGTSLRH